jgi:hypothetical protein
MMGHKDSIALYIAGLADGDAQAQIEDALLNDAGFLERFIEVNEQLICTAPSGFADTAMRGIRLQTSTAKVPVLSRKLCAAACFCSAIAIMLFTVTDINQRLVDFAFAHSGKLTEVLSLLKF